MSQRTNSNPKSTPKKETKTVKATPKKRVKNPKITIQPNTRETLPCLDDDRYVEDVAVNRVIDILDAFHLRLNEMDKCQSMIICSQLMLAMAKANAKVNGIKPRSVAGMEAFAAEAIGDMTIKVEPKGIDIVTGPRLVWYYRGQREKPSDLGYGLSFRRTARDAKRAKVGAQ